MSIVTSVRGPAPRDKAPFYHPKEVSALYTFPKKTKTVFKKSEFPSEFAFEPDTDISQILQSSQAPLQAEPRHNGGLSVAGLLEVLPTGVVILDRQGKIQQCNPAAEKLLGSGLKEQYWRDVITANFDPREDDGHEVSLISGKRVSLMTRSLIEGEGQLIVITDLTETRELQNQLNRHQRLSAMGQMMSSLAHQIRTPLSAALLHADNLTAANGDLPQVRASGEKIISRLHSIERQIRDMLVFAKGGTTETCELSLNLMTDKLKAAATDLAKSHGASIQWRCTAEPASLKCNADALIGAFLNLLENAIQASGSSKQIIAEIEIFRGDTEYQNDRLLMRVIDSGSGIDDAMLAKLEEPFNTTKPNGTGLGLAIVKLVCKSHGGNFRFVPQETGTCAEMNLPVFAAGASL